MTSNFVISPLSLDFVLNLMFLGATKNTFAEMKNGLEYPNDFTIKIIESNLQKWSTVVKSISGVEVGELFSFFIKFWGSCVWLEDYFCMIRGRLLGLLLDI